MPAMRMVGARPQLSEHVHVRRDPDEYVIELDVDDFRDDEIVIEALGPSVTVRCDQREDPEDAGRPFRLREHLEQSFRLPDDADAERIRAFRRHRTLQIRAPRRPVDSRRVPIEGPFHELLHDAAEPC